MEIINSFDVTKLKKYERGVVGIGSMSDTYNPQELKYEQTRSALKLISKYNN